jgi:hypothetical protein
MDLGTALAGRRDGRQFRVGQVKAATTGAKSITVTLDGTDVLVPVLTGTTYAVGQTVLVARDGRQAGYVLGAIGQPPAPPTPTEPPPAPPPSQAEPGAAVKRYSKTLVPSSTGTYRGGSWRSTRDLYQGDWGGWGVNLGAAFYGGQFAGLRAKTTHPRSAVLRYSRTQGGVFGSQAPTFWTLTQRARPAGAPTRRLSAVGDGVTTSGSGRHESWALPADMLDELLTGAAGGLGIYVPGSTPYIVLDSPADVATSMSVTVTYYA